MADSRRTTFVFIERDGQFVPVGKLDFYEGGRATRSVFQYGARYAARKDAISIDPEMLPLPEPGRPHNPVTTPENFELFNGLRDAAPDGWGRYLMNKAAKGKVLTEFDYLVASGKDRVGALAFGPDPRKAPQRIAPWGDDGVDRQLDLAEITEAAKRVLSLDDIVRDYPQFLDQASSLGGARPKASVEFGGRHWIAKFGRERDDYNVCRAEHAAMTLAAECGLAVPETMVTPVRGVDVYLIRRFDREQMVEGTVRRIPFVSALTMLGAHEMSAHRHSYADIADAIRRHGSSPAADLRELFKRMAFNILCTNDDDHLRNHGFLHDGRDWRLSPGYDIVPKPQRSHERRLVLDVGDHGKEATLANAMTQCRRFGLEPDEARGILEDMRRVVAARWEAVCRESGVPADDMERLATCFREAMREDWDAELRPGVKR